MQCHFNFGQQSNPQQSLTHIPMYCFDTATDPDNEALT